MLSAPVLYLFFALILFIIPVYSGLKGIDNKLG